jgi:hypothetical protein
LFAQANTPKLTTRRGTFADNDQLYYREEETTTATAANIVSSKSTVVDGADDGMPDGTPE